MANKATQSAQTTGERRVSSRVAARQASAEAVKEADSAKKAPAAKATKKRPAAKDEEEAEADSKKKAAVASADDVKKGEASKKAKTDVATVNGDEKPASGRQLKVGEAVPEMTLSDESGQSIEVGKLKKAVIFMYVVSWWPVLEYEATVVRAHKPPPRFPNVQVPQSQYRRMHQPSSGLSRRVLLLEGFGIQRVRSVIGQRHAAQELEGGASMGPRVALCARRRHQSARL